MSASDLSIRTLALFVACALFGSPSFAQSGGVAGAAGSGLTVRAADISAIRVSVNTKRQACGLAVQAWTDDPLTTGTAIKKVHLLELRAAVVSAYTSQSKTPPAFTDPNVTAATPVKAVHFNEVKSAVAALSCALAVNGACGGANGNSYALNSDVNTAGLCGIGTASPSSVVGAGPWSWTCQGANGGTNASCGASLGKAACEAGASQAGLGGATPTAGCQCAKAGDVWNTFSKACFSPAYMVCRWHGGGGGKGSGGGGSGYELVKTASAPPNCKNPKLQTFSGFPLQECVTFSVLSTASGSCSVRSNVRRPDGSTQTGVEYGATVAPGACGGVAPVTICP